ncbi:MAG: PQQ-binding-like beta-propeller repeat protein, partial [Akkermansiaceae bacterium]
LAPTIAGEQVIFGCDDSHVYSVNAKTGKLNWKSGVPEAAKEHLPGNGRMISLYPIRTGILVRGKTAYFGCGLFPKNAAAWYCSLDIRTGKIIDRKPLQKSLQGYLADRDGRIFAPTGRDPSGAFVATLEKKQKTAGKPTSLATATIPKQFPYSFASTAKHGVGGGNGKVALLNASNGSLIWQAKVPGIAREIAIADNRVIVSTDEGKILCFGKKRDTEASQQTASYPSQHKMDTLLDSVENLKKFMPYTKGYALVMDAETDGGKLLHSLATSSNLTIIALAKNPDSADRLRRSIAAQKLYGTRVSIYPTPKQLPYRAKSFNLITSASKARSLTSSRLKSLLRPATGIIWQVGSDKALYRAPALKGAGEWTHMYADPANTACSQDTRVGSSLALQWFGRPGPQHIIDRHLRPTPPLVKNGLLITPGNNYLIATDGWNGTVLWEKPIPNMRRIGALRDSGNTVLTNDLLYVASGSECLALDIHTGYEKRQLTLPPEFSANTHEWGYLASVGSGIIGTAVKKGTVLREMSPRAIYSGGYGDNTTIATSDAVFAMDRHSGKHHWTYKAKGAVFNPSIAISNKKIFLI